MANENRIAQQGVEVLYTPGAEPNVRIAQQGVEVAYSQGAAAQLRVTQLAVEVLWVPAPALPGTQPLILSNMS